MAPPPATAITDRLVVPVKGGVDDWKEPYKQLLLTFKEQPGYIRTRWGPRSENPQMLDLMIGWTSTEARDAFLSSAAHTACMERMGSVLDGKPLNYTIKFQPYAPREAINSPIVEMITISNCTGSEDALRATIEKAFALPGCRGGASGFATADVDGLGRVFVGALGWESAEDAKAADKAVYTPSGAGDVDVSLINYNFPIKGFSVTNSD